MPSYEYRCPKCKTKFELLRRIAARDDEATCPKCKATTPKRIEVQRIAVLRLFRARHGENQCHESRGQKPAGDALSAP